MLTAVMERYDTALVAPEARIGYWRDIVARTSTPSAFDYDNPEHVHCSLVRGVFERFTVSHVVTSQIRVFRAKPQTRDARGSSFLYLQMEGEGELVALGRTMRTRPGSLVLFDETTPYRFQALSPNRVMSIGFPTSLLEARLPEYRDIAMRPIDGGDGPAQVLLAAMQAINGMFVDQGVRRFPRALFTGLIEMMAASIDAADDCAEHVGTLARWAGKIRAHVETNLDDHDLTPASIARTFGISPRYLRLIFASAGPESGEGETLRRFILRRRLEECAARLADTTGRTPSITQLAHSWGFSDSSYFARRFIEHFHLTPRSYRAAMVAKAGSDGGDPIRFS